MRHFPLNLRKSKSPLNTIAANDGKAAVVKENSTSASRLLQLPGELRNQIYSYALFPENDRIMIANITNSFDLGASVLQSPLFKISRQIREEALAFLCSTKQITFTSRLSGYVFFREIGPIAVQNVRHITLVLQGMNDSTGSMFFEALRQATALKNLNVELHINYDNGAEAGFEVGKGTYKMNIVEELAAFMQEKKNQELTFRWRCKWTSHWGRLMVRASKEELQQALVRMLGEDSKDFE